jgi:hypothetical protein
MSQVENRKSEVGKVEPGHERENRGRDSALRITDEELRKALTGVWERRRQLKAVGE